MEQLRSRRLRGSGCGRGDGRRGVVGGVVYRWRMMLCGLASIVWMGGAAVGFSAALRHVTVGSVARVRRLIERPWAKDGGVRW